MQLPSYGCGSRSPPRCATITRDRERDWLTRCMLAGVGQPFLNEPVRRPTAHRWQARQLLKRSLHRHMTARVSGFLDQPWQVRRCGLGPVMIIGILVEEL